MSENQTSQHPLDMEVAHARYGGEWLRDLRVRSGTTVEDLAHTIGCSPATIEAIEGHGVSISHNSMLTYINAVPGAPEMWWFDGMLGADDATAKVHDHRPDRSSNVSDQSSTA